MRTTLTIDDKLMAELKKRAFQSDRSFKEVVNETLRQGLAGTGSLPVAGPYRIDPVPMGRPGAGIDLSKATTLAGLLEDEELAKKMQLRKWF